MKAPITDRTLGLVVGKYPDDKFADVRKRARDEYVLRGKRKKKDKSVKVPDHKVGDLVVCANAYYRSNRNYHLLEIVDFSESITGFEYYGILVKTTNKGSLVRVGRLMKTGTLFGFNPINIPEGSIKWLEESPTK